MRAYPFEYVSDALIIFTWAAFIVAIFAVETYINHMECTNWMDEQFTPYTAVPSLNIVL